MSGAEARARPSATAPGRDEPWTVLRLILWSADWLTGKGVESARLDAEHLLAHAVGTDRLQLYLEFERPLVPEELDAFRPLLRRRGAREPLQYILGRQPFRELDLVVGPGVLVPRPETEVLVGEVLSWVETAALEAPTALDLGTGSGAVALALAHEGNFTHVVATDVSKDALAMARTNREAAGLSESVELREGSLFGPLSADERFDVIVSNPPYVGEVDEASLDPEVREWEPRAALFAGPDGLDVIRAIVGGARPFLNQGGLLALEVGGDQAARVAAMMKDHGAYRDVRTIRDYTGTRRFVFAHGA